MTPERYQLIATLYHAAQEVEAERRGEFLAKACNGDEELLREVTKLLAGNDDARNFLSAPAFAVAAQALAGEEKPSFIGKRLGRFEILSMLGVGGMGEVYLAKDAQLGRRVALKLLPQEFTSHPDRLRRFEREARAASALNHPNIITIHDIGEAEGIHFIATEYIEGEMLRRRIARGRMPLGEAVDIALQVANALDIAHSAGIIHRDIKPENIMRRPDGYVKVLDFGLAKLTEPKPAPPVTSQIDTPPLSSETSAGMILGTVNYMSPEQARGLKVDRRCDIWSLGVTLYEMVVGKSPFTGQTATDILVSIVDRQPQPLTQVIPDLPAELERIVTKALAKDCDERYQSAKDLAIDLKRLRREVEGSPAVIPTPEAEVAKSTLQNALYTTDALSEAKTAPINKSTVSPARIALAAILVAVVGFAGWWMLRPQSSVTIPPPATTSTPAPNAPTVFDRQISYALLIQKMKVGEDGKLLLDKDKKPQTDGQPYLALERETFGSHDRFSFQFSAPQEGHLYLLNVETQENEEPLYTLQFPTSNGGSAKLLANQQVLTGRYLFDPSKPVENLLLIWAERQVEVLEAAKEKINPQAFDAIRDPEQIDALKRFLEQHKPSKEVFPDESAKQTRVQGSGEVLVHLIKLTHQ